MSAPFGLIAGSGLGYLGLEILSRSAVETPYGPPSSALLEARIGAQSLLCIARHGERHTIAPDAVNYRANVWALREAGVDRIVAINSVGAIADGFAPGDLAVPDQLIDYTWGRESTFGAEDAVVHVELGEPFDPVLRGALAEAIAGSGLPVRAGVYGVTQGPRLETAAEIDRLARDGCTMVGMTAMPEAALARELAIDYAICAVAVNYAAGRSPSGRSIHSEIVEYLRLGMSRAAAVVARLATTLAAC
jgi:5'-methylthioinosine phosphorylase